MLSTVMTIFIWVPLTYVALYKSFSRQNDLFNLKMQNLEQQETQNLILDNLAESLMII